MNKILVGSRYFFSEYSDFHPKDIDEVQFVDTNEFSQMRQITGKGRCLFQMKRHSSKEEYIKYALKSSSGMVIGKFLVPEFCRAIGFSIKDLKKLSPLIQRLDENHLYERVIYNSYIKNNSFTLTKEQRDLAYQSYKSAREER